MKKKLLALLVATTVAGVALVGCGKSDSTSGDKNADAETSATEAGDEETSAEEPTEPEYEKVKLTATLDDYTSYVTLPDYTGLDIEVDSAKVTDEQMKEAIASVIKAGVKYEQITDRTVKDGDTINMDFKGLLDGEAFEGGTATGYTYTVGGSFIKSLNDQLIGLECGKEYNLDCTFPEDYGKEELNGKDVVFVVTVNYINGEEITPEWTDDFIKEYTSDKYTSTADFEKYLEAQVSSKNLSEQETSFHTSLITKIVDSAEVSEIPEEKISEIADMMYKYYSDAYKNYAEMYKQEYDAFLEQMGISDDQLKEDCQKEAETQVEYIMIMDAIATKEGITIDEEEYNETAFNLLMSYGYTTIADFEKDYGQKYLLESFLGDKVCEFLYANNNMVVEE